MKSLIYRIFRKPSTFDDCIDFVRSNDITKASFKLEEKGLIYENDFGSALYASLCFHNSRGGTRTGRVHCVSLRNSWLYSDRADVCRKANEKVDDFLNALGKLGVTVADAHLRFSPDHKLATEGQVSSPEKQVIEKEPASPASLRSPGKPKAVISKPAYLRFANDQLILRDELAVDRTLLANERTFLAYLRSAVALAIAGVSIINFAEQRWFWLIGAVCIPVAIVTAIVGTMRHRSMGHSISLVRGTLGSTANKRGGLDWPSVPGAQAKLNMAEFGLFGVIFDYHRTSAVVADFREGYISWHPMY